MRHVGERVEKGVKAFLFFLVQRAGKIGVYARAKKQFRDRGSGKSRNGVEDMAVQISPLKSVRPLPSLRGEEVGFGLFRGSVSHAAQHDMPASVIEA